MPCERECAPTFVHPKGLTIDLGVELLGGIALFNDFHVFNDAVIRVFIKYISVIENWRLAGWRGLTFLKNAALFTRYPLSLGFIRKSSVFEVIDS